MDTFGVSALIFKVVLHTLIHASTGYRCALDNMTKQGTVSYHSLGVQFSKHMSWF
jgi:hypothetical protein